MGSNSWASIFERRSPSVAGAPAWPGKATARPLWAAPRCRIRPVVRPSSLYSLKAGRSGSLWVAQPFLSGFRPLRASPPSLVSLLFSGRGAWAPDRPRTAAHGGGRGAGAAGATGKGAGRGQSTGKPTTGIRVVPNVSCGSSGSGGQAAHRLGGGRVGSGVGRSERRRRVPWRLRWRCTRRNQRRRGRRVRAPRRRGG